MQDKSDEPLKEMSGQLHDMWVKLSELVRISHSHPTVMAIMEARAAIQDADTKVFRARMAVLKHEG